MRKAVSLALSITLSLGFAEALLRLPPVVALTGGGTPGMAHWEATHYDDVVWRSNRLHLRSFHLETTKPEGVFRVLALGDSMTWGVKIPRTEDTWPYVVESGLRKNGHAVEVVNMGQSGFTTVNEAELLEREGWAFQPDLIVVQFTLNDPLPSEPNYVRQGESWLFRTIPLSPVLHHAFDRNSYLYSLLNAQWRSIQIQRRYPNGYAPLYEDNFSGWQECQKALRQIALQSRQRGVPVILAIYPSFAVPDDFDSSYPYLDLHSKISNVAQEVGFNVLDLRPVFSKFGRPARSWWALPGDAHAGVEGQRVAGDAIRERIESVRGVN